MHALPRGSGNSAACLFVNATPDLSVLDEPVPDRLTKHRPGSDTRVERARCRRILLLSESGRISNPHL